MLVTYTVVLLHEQDGRYSAVVPALDCASWGRSVPDALRNVEEALGSHLESLAAHGDTIPDDATSFTVEMGDAVDAVIYKIGVRRPGALAARSRLRLDLQPGWVYRPERPRSAWRDEGDCATARRRRRCQGLPGQDRRDRPAFGTRRHQD